ncbi:MAG TPA: hypothetical protein DEP45_00060 [Armatimonadetes bacterium]|nr:hypothetical protein [Armatimonadota bacterium]
MPREVTRNLLAGDATMAEENQGPITNADLAIVCRQFATLTKADINILEILETLRAQTTNALLREVLDQVQQDVEMGHTLATSFSRYPNTFSPFFITMIREGELEGDMDRVFDDLADHFETQLGGTPDARRPARAGLFDWEAAASAFQWIFIWLCALGAACAIGAGLIWYATAGPTDRIGLPGDRIPNILIFIGIILGLGVLLFTRGRRRL